MEPASQNAWIAPHRLTRIALAVALGASHAGCSRMGWTRRDERPPAVLGSLRAESTSGTYAVASNAEPAPIAGQDPIAGAIVAQDPASPGEVQLLPPAEADPRPNPRLASATVPDAARLIASAERPRVTPAGLVADARASLDPITSYQVALHRQERANGVLGPEEDVILAIRREPRAVRLTWPSGPHQGREVLYRSDEPGGMMHVNMADSAIPVPRLTLSPESPMVMKNSRHPITEAGFDSIVASLDDALKLTGPEAMSYAGMETPEFLDHPHHCLIRTTSTGERWRTYLDPSSHLPALVRCESANGDLQEFYVFRDLQTNLPELVATGAFDPDIRWGPPKGLFGRLTRANDAATPR